MDKSVTVQVKLYGVVCTYREHVVTCKEAHTSFMAIIFQYVVGKGK